MPGCWEAFFFSRALRPAITQAACRLAVRYSPRGRLLSQHAGAPDMDETTAYSCDSAGQLKKVTLPDASFIDYTHDDAHRLIAIADNSGNRIAWTLDALGNRTGETVTDPSGTLARQSARVFDALNRLQQVTGTVP